MVEKFTRWDPVDHLATEADQAMYLNACLATIMRVMRALGVHLHAMVN